jgi:hypothetical protein
MKMVMYHFDCNWWGESPREPEFAWFFGSRGRSPHRIAIKMQIDFYGCVRRKNKFPDGEVMVIKLFVPSLEMPPLVDQPAVAKFGFCCSVQPVDGYGQEIFTLLPDVASVFRAEVDGTPAFSTATLTNNRFRFIVHGWSGTKRLAGGQWHRHPACALAWLS